MSEKIDLINSNENIISTSSKENNDEIIINTEEKNNNNILGFSNDFNSPLIENDNNLIQDDKFNFK